MPTGLPVKEPARSRPKAATTLPAMHFRECIELEHHLLKVYVSADPGLRVTEGLVAVAKRLAALELRADPRHAQANGAGMLAIHHGAAATRAFLDRWSCETELLHSSFVGNPAPPYQLQPAPLGADSMPIGYIEMLEFERRAWSECVLGRAHAPDVAGYFARQLAPLR